MDISLCNYTPNSFKLEFSGTLQDLFLKSDGELTFFKGDRRGFGETHDYKFREFTSHNLKLMLGGKICLSSNSFSNQFGRIKGKKIYKNA